MVDLCGRNKTGRADLKSSPGPHLPEARTTPFTEAGASANVARQIEIAARFDRMCPKHGG
jgi:hypothetical protein